MYYFLIKIQRQHFIIFLCCLQPIFDQAMAQKAKEEADAAHAKAEAEMALGILVQNASKLVQKHY